MFEKVNPAHPDKIADRIAGAIVDLAYRIEVEPRIAVEVLIGHGECRIIIETDSELDTSEIVDIVYRIAGPSFSEPPVISINMNKQDGHLAANAANYTRTGDNGIFRGVPANAEELQLTRIAGEIYEQYQTDGKCILAKMNGKKRLIVCQSNADDFDIERIARKRMKPADTVDVNPLGPWTGGTDVDTGATNRKLGSDMGRGATGGGLHGKDLSKADVTVNIYAYLKATNYCRPIDYFCGIGDKEVSCLTYGTTVPFEEMIRVAREYIKEIGGFEKFAEWGLIRP